MCGRSSASSCLLVLAGGGSSSARSHPDLRSRSRVSTSPTWESDRSRCGAAGRGPGATSPTGAFIATRCSATTRCARTLPSSSLKAATWTNSSSRGCFCLVGALVGRSDVRRLTAAPWSRPAQRFALPHAWYRAGGLEALTDLSCARACTASPTGPMLRPAGDSPIDPRQAPATSTARMCADDLRDLRARRPPGAGRIGHDARVFGVPGSQQRTVGATAPRRAATPWRD